MFLKVFLWSLFTLWPFYKYQCLLLTFMHFFCFSFGYFEVITHQILLIMVIMLFYPTLRQLGASFCGFFASQFYCSGVTLYVSVVIFYSSVFVFELMWVFCDHDASMFWVYALFDYLWIIYAPLWSFCCLIVTILMLSLPLRQFCGRFLLLWSLCGNVFLSLWPFCARFVSISVFCARLLPSSWWTHLQTNLKSILYLHRSISGKVTGLEVKLLTPWAGWTCTSKLGQV